MGREVVSLFVESVGTWSSKDMNEANSCIEKGETLVKMSMDLSQKANELEGKPAMAAELIAGSVKRVAEYSMDIAEIAINSVMD